MVCYFAPMEGITGYTYRKIWRSWFGGADKIFMPFVSPTQNGRFAPKEIREMSAELADSAPVVPQLMVNNADNFIWAANALCDMGFKEVNLNAGCPSGTVVSKHKGAGMLTSPDELDAILERIFDSVSDIEISVKTRLGLADDREFDRIMSVYNRYPISELIVHARVRSDFYKEPVHPEAYNDAEKIAKMPICYNGDIFSFDEAKRFSTAHPNTAAVMLGRGVLADPALIREIKTGEALRLQELRPFHDALFDEYRSVLYGDVTVLHKMKELWFYMGKLFIHCESCIRAINKSQCADEYISAVGRLFKEAEFIGSKNVHFA